MNMTNPEKFKFSPNAAIDTAIKELLPNFSPESQRRMRKAILDAKKSAEKHHDENTDAGARHIFREFIPASILNQSGFAFEYERPISGKKPDWVDESANLMLDSYTYERGGTSSFLDRVTALIADKCGRYKDIIAATSLRFVVFVYLDFLTGMSLDECREDAEPFRPVFMRIRHCGQLFSSRRRTLLIARNTMGSSVFARILPSRPFRTGRLKL